MILELSKPPYEIGAVRRGCNGADGVWRPDQPFIIKREATAGEWAQQCRDYGVSECDISRQLAIAKRFFEVLID